MPNPYFRLMRLHQPTGIWLLLFPCWWSVALAGPLLSNLWYIVLFGIGAVVMRGAGCIVNDMADRKFDAKVERTRGRPLASGELTMKQASIALAILLAIALLIALLMNALVLELAFASLVLVAAYPFMKRITWWPQAFLGLTFNWGALMGWAAVRGTLDTPALLLYLGGVFWTLGYDTIYAHQDKADDVSAGVKSTALLFGAETKKYLSAFYAIAAVLWLIAGTGELGGLFIFCMLLVSVQFVWQVMTVELDDPASCQRIFRSNTKLGWLMFASIAINSILLPSL